MKNLTPEQLKNYERYKELNEEIFIEGYLLDGLEKFNEIRSPFYTPLDLLINEILTIFLKINGIDF